MLKNTAMGRRKHVKECLIIPSMELKLVVNTTKRKVEDKDNG
jgi:hypothetical protein